MSIAVLIPCFNEEQTVAEVIASARCALPEAEIWVCDNSSSDGTAAVACQAGARVIAEPCRGKGHAVRRLFAEAEADYYILVDGDATYELKDAPSFLRKMQEERLDFINVARTRPQKNAYRTGHRFGNWLLSRVMSLFFGNPIKDMLSGYKLFSRRFVKTFPAQSRGFEVETELTVFALSCRMPLAEEESPYYARPEGSLSKLSTVRDGTKILWMLFGLVKEERPLLFFTCAAFLFALAGVCLSVPVFITYAHTGLVPRLPTAVLSVGLMVWALLFFIAGIILDTLACARRAAQRRAYLAVTRRK